MPLERRTALHSLALDGTGIWELRLLLIVTGDWERWPAGPFGVFVNCADLESAGCLAVLRFLHNSRNFGKHARVYHEVFWFEQIKGLCIFTRVQRVFDRAHNIPSPPDSLRDKNILNARKR